MTKEQLLKEAQAEQELAQKDEISFLERIPHFFKAHELYITAGDKKSGFQMLGMYYLSKVAADAPENKKENFAKCLEAFKESGDKNFYRAMKAAYLAYLAGEEKNKHKKAKLYEQEAYELSKVKSLSPEEIAKNGDYYLQAQKDIHIAKAKRCEALVQITTEAKKHDTKKMGELFKECAEEYSKAGDEKKFNLYMSFHYLYSSLYYYSSFSPECLPALKKACEHAEKADNPECLAKVKSAYLRAASYFQNDFNKRIQYLEEACGETEKTADKFLLYELKGTIEELKARHSGDPKEKSALFLKAAELFKKEPTAIEKSQICEALSKLILANAQNVSFKERIILYKDALRILKSTKAKRLYYKSLGELFLVQAISYGLVSNNSKRLVYLQFRASKAFQAGGYFLEGNLYSGLAFLAISSHLSFPKNIEAIGIAANNLLLTSHIEVYDLACHKLYQILIENESDESKKDIYRRKSLLHLAAYIKIEAKKSQARMCLEFLPFDAKLLNNLFEAEYYKLLGDLPENAAKKQELDQRALSIFDDIIAKGNANTKEMAYRGKGWLLRDRGQFDLSVEVFRQAVKELPKLSSLQKEMQIAEKLLQEDYRKLKSNQEIKELRLDYQNQLLAQRSPLDKNNVDEEAPIEDFETLVFKSLLNVGNRLEEIRGTCRSQGEEHLRDIMLVQLQNIPQIGEAATRESKHGEGKTDIHIAIDKEKAISECLVWKGEEYYKSKEKQLLGNLTDKQKFAFLVTFFKDQDFVGTINRAQKCVTDFDDFEKDSLEIIEIDVGTPGKTFSSLHVTKWRTKLKIYHLFFCLS
ncbi:MAG: hypothetical protein PHR44_02295 [Candidatus Omnitrophica bacterium]|nr:hypothetical protein [Candidatus Omnitrophota bacterium]